MRISDWSSDVCSSDLDPRAPDNGGDRRRVARRLDAADAARRLPRARTRTARPPELARQAQADARRAGPRRELDPRTDARSLSEPRTANGRASCRERECQYV